MFGSSNLFGGPPQTSSASSNLFGGTSQVGTSPSAQQQPSLFGQSSSLFGGSGQQPSNLGGGAAPQPQAQTTGLFGGGQQPTPLFGGGQQSTSLFGGGASQPTSLFGTAGVAQPQPQQQPSLFGQGATGSGGLFGGTSQQPTAATVVVPSFSLAKPEPSSFSGWGSGSSTQQQQQPVRSSLFGTTIPTTFGGQQGGGLSSFQTPAQQQGGGLSSFQTPAQQQGRVVEPEVQVVLRNLSNADSRSEQILTDSFRRVKSLAAEQPLLLSFTYEIEDADPQTATQRRNQLENSLAQLNNTSTAEAYFNATKNSPDPSKFRVVVIEGFEGMIARTKLQQRHVEHLNQILRDLKSKQEVVRNHLEIQSLKRIRDIARRQRRLMSSVMRTVGKLEEYALRSNLAQVDGPFLRRVQTDLARLVELQQGSSLSHYSLSQASSKLHSLMNNLTSLDGTGSDLPADDSKDVGGGDANHTEGIQLNRLKNAGLDDWHSSRDCKVIRKLLQKQELLLSSLESLLRVSNHKATKLLEIAEDWPQTPIAERDVNYS